MRTEPRSLIVATHNIQVGIGSHRPRHLLAHAWRYLLPHEDSVPNLERIAQGVEAADLVGLNEVDGGSFRSQYLNQAAYLAERGGFPHWTREGTRDWGNVAQHSNALLSQWPILEVESHRFAGTLKGRGWFLCRLDIDGEVLEVAVTHLALGSQGRRRQLRQILQHLSLERPTLLMGDFNCTPSSPEWRALIADSGLQTPSKSLATFPGWSPRRAYDHILCTSHFRYQDLWVGRPAVADHLALMARLEWQAPTTGATGATAPSPVA